jgi:type I restriction enzyme, S subunit
LEIYRQAVLKKAFEGELTKGWRGKNNSVLLKQNESINGQKFRYNSYPNYWKCVRLEQVSKAIGGYAFKSAEFNKTTGKYQVLRIGNIRPGIIRFDESPVFINKVENNILSKSKLLTNDVLITLTGTRKKRDYGYTAIVNRNNLLLNQRLAALRFNENCMPEFFLYFSWTNDFKEQFFGSETGNVGQGNVGMKSVRSTVIPLPPVQEQIEIVQEIETRLSVCDNIQANIEEGLIKAEALRQSILKKAFEGRLLSEEELEACRKESDWEPADKLLERIEKSKEEDA